MARNICWALYIDVLVFRDRVKTIASYTAYGFDLADKEIRFCQKYMI